MMKNYIYLVITAAIWHWIAAITFAMFNFETFYAFVLATLGAYNAVN